MRKKLKDSRGETLLEVLVSILVGTLSVALLFSAVGASGRMDKNAKAADDTLSKSLDAAEKQEAPFPAAGSGSVTIKGESGGVEATPPVDFYGGEDALSYALQTSPP